MDIMEKSIFDDVIDAYIKTDTISDTESLFSNDVLADTFNEMVLSKMESRLRSTVHVGDILSSIRKRFEYLRLLEERGLIALDSDAHKKVESLNRLEGDIYLSILHVIEKFYDFEIDIDDDSILLDDIRSLVENVYIFFVEEYDENCLILFHSYVISNEDENAKRYPLDQKIKDLAIISLKDKLDDDMVGICSIYNLSQIMDQALSEFKENESYLVEYIVRYDENEITFNSIGKLFLPDDDENDDHIPIGILGVNFVERFLRPLESFDVKMSLKSKLENILTEEYLLMKDNY